MTIMTFQEAKEFCAMSSVCCTIRKVRGQQAVRVSGPAEKVEYFTNGTLRVTLGGELAEILH